MYLGFSDFMESFEEESELYDSNCSLIGTSDDIEYAEYKSQQHDENTSLLNTLS